MPFRVIDSIDRGRQSIYNVNVLAAIRWIGSEWETLRSSWIKIRFQKRIMTTKDGGVVVSKQRHDIRYEVEPDVNASKV